MEKGLKDRLRVLAAQIPEEGKELSEDLPREWLTNIPEFSNDEDTHMEGPIRVRGRVMREGENLRLKGEVAADLVTFCTRCGETINYVLSGKVDVILIKGQEPARGDEHELTPDEAAATYYDGVEADLAPFFREEIAIQVPLQPLCRPDCAGLCSVCGTNLNNGKCGCGQKEADPRLAGLRNLKLNS
ncbi:MAG TPA: DUF177 domain-containing protein [bacterium]|nr:DUF177 domain-containing protein [bacterium]